VGGCGLDSSASGQGALQYVFMAWCVVKRREKFTFTFYGTRSSVGVCVSGGETTDLFKCRKSKKMKSVWN